MCISTVAGGDSSSLCSSFLRASKSSESTEERKNQAQAKEEKTNATNQAKQEPLKAIAATPAPTPAVAKKESVGWIKWVVGIAALAAVIFLVRALSPAKEDGITASATDVVKSTTEAVKNARNKMYEEVPLIDKTLGVTGQAVAPSEECEKFNLQVHTCYFNKGESHVIGITFGGDPENKACVSLNPDERTIPAADRKFVGVWYLDKSGSGEKQLDPDNLPKDYVALRYQANQEFTLTYWLAKDCS
jgi:hypothetical protein